MAKQAAFPQVVVVPTTRVPWQQQFGPYNRLGVQNQQLAQQFTGGLTYAAGGMGGFAGGPAGARAGQKRGEVAGAGGGKQASAETAARSAPVPSQIPGSKAGPSAPAFDGPSRAMNDNRTKAAQEAGEQGASRQPQNFDASPAAPANAAAAPAAVAQGAPMQAAPTPASVVQASPGTSRPCRTGRPSRTFKTCRTCRTKRCRRIGCCSCSAASKRRCRWLLSPQRRPLKPKHRRLATRLRPRPVRRPCRRRPTRRRSTRLPSSGSSGPFLVNKFSPRGGRRPAAPPAGKSIHSRQNPRRCAPPACSLSRAASSTASIRARIAALDLEQPGDCPDFRPTKMGLSPSVNQGPKEAPSRGFSDGSTRRCRRHLGNGYHR